MASVRSSVEPKIPCRDCIHRTGMGFTDLSCSELKFMSSFKESHEVAWAGDLLVREGQPSCLIGTLYSGMAIQYRRLAANKRQILSVLMPGDLIGLECLHAERPSHSIEAVTDVTYCLFSRERWQELLEFPDIAARLFERQLVEQRAIEDRIVALGGCSAPGRVASFLVDLHQRMRIRRLAAERCFVLPLTKQQLADAVGLTPVHLTRVMNKLRAEGVIALEDRKVHILNPSRFRALAEALSPDVGLVPLI